MVLQRDVSNKFKWMGLLAALMVVAIHVYPQPDGWGTPAWWVKSLLSDGICRMAVPFFFLASGYFLAGHVEETNWWGREVHKRIKSLVLPLFIWNGLWFMCCYGTILAANLLAGRELTTNMNLSINIWTKLLSIDPCDQPLLGVLWFLRALFLVIVLSPIILLFLQNRRRAIVFLSAVSIVYATFCPDYEFERTMCFVCMKEGFVSVFAIFYFSIGMLFRLQHIDLQKSSRKGVVLLWGAVVVVLAVRQILWLYMGPHEGFAYFGLILRPLLIVGFWSICPSCDFPNILAGLAFPIYLIHMISLFFMGVLHVRPPTDTAWGYVLCAFLNMFFAMCISIALKKNFPRLAGVLFGGR